MLWRIGNTRRFTDPRFNLTMKVEWLYVRPSASDEEHTAALADFLNRYNHERPHGALANKPPASRVPVHSGLAVRAPTCAVDQLAFQWCKERLALGGIEAIAQSAH